MKKLLTVSLVAVMAVSAAHADLASTAYVDGKIGDEIATLDVTEQRVAGSYVAFVNEADGKVASQKVAFDQAISSASTHDNAPTSKAVYDAINGVAGDVAGLDLDAAPESGKYVSTVAQADGQVSQQLVAFDGEIKAGADGNYSVNAPTAGAVADFVNAAITVFDENQADFKNTVAQHTSDISGLNTRLGDAEDLIDEHTDAIAANRTDIGTMTQDDQTGQVTEFANTDYIKDSKTLSAAAVALDDAIGELGSEMYGELDTKQDKADADYQIGSNGGWINLIDTLPAKCKAANAECAMVARGGKLAWELISGATTVEGEISPVTPAAAE